MNSRLKDLRLLVALAFRELRQMKFLFLMLVVNLSWGLAAYLTLASLRQSTQKVFLEKAKHFLSAEFSVSTRRLFDDAEKSRLRQLIGRSAIASEKIQLLSMASGANESRLVQLVAVEDRFPLFGQIKLQSGRIVSRSEAKEIAHQFKAWVSAEALQQLNMKVGDQLNLGGKSFVIDDVVVEDDTQALRFIYLAPRVFVGVEPLRTTELLGLGATVTDAMDFAFEPEKSVQELKDLKKSVLEEFSDPAVGATTFLEAGEDAGRFLGYLLDDLGLGALVGLSLAAFGTAALIYSWLHQKVRIYAIYNSLGLTPLLIQGIFFLQLTGVSLVTSLVACGLVSAALPWLAHFVQGFFPTEIGQGLTSGQILKGFLLIWGGSIFLSLPFALSLRKIPTARLFAEMGPSLLALKTPSLFAWVPALGFFWFAATREVNSWRIGSLFFFGLLGFYFLLTILGWLSFRLCASQVGAVGTSASQVRAVGTSAELRGPWWMIQGILYLARKPSLLPTFVALSIGTLVTVLIPQLRAGLHREMMDRSNEPLPSLFLIDIQDEQIPEVEKFFHERNRELVHLSPFIRARILEVNGKSFERAEPQTGFDSRESEQSARLRNRGVNLSYRQELYTSEKLVAGRPFTPPTLVPRDPRDPQQPIELSVENWYAERMGLHLNDLVLLDIQGIELPGKIVNLRKVRWERFEPNFFIIAQPGALDGAPRTWLANVGGANLPALPMTEKQQLRNDLAHRFPNVSSIDVQQTLERALSTVDQIAKALEILSYVTWTSGLLVLTALLYRQISAQEWDANLIRLLGARRRELFALFQTEFSLLVIIAITLGGLGAIGASWFISQEFFDGIFWVDGLSFLLTLAVLWGLGLAFVLLFSLRLSRTNPARILYEVRL
ncbi:MAG: hypothetical protein C5B49_08770 [Bdellovibrio sp.]|nr:MAG: hypothetical protein C5B49_08770 [Bdellovibrio sp.]